MDFGHSERLHGRTGVYNRTRLHPFDVESPASPPRVTGGPAEPKGIAPAADGEPERFRSSVPRRGAVCAACEAGRWTDDRTRPGVDLKEAPEGRVEPLGLPPWPRRTYLSVPSPRPPSALAVPSGPERPPPARSVPLCFPRFDHSPRPSVGSAQPQHSSSFSSPLSLLLGTPRDHSCRPRGRRRGCSRWHPILLVASIGLLRHPSNTLPGADDRSLASCSHRPRPPSLAATPAQSEGTRATEERL